MGNIVERKKIDSNIFDKLGLISEFQTEYFHPEGSFVVIITY